MDKLSLRLILLLPQLVLLVPAVIVSAEDCTSTDPCEDQPDCAGCLNSDKVPDPLDCRKYYVCYENNPSLISFPCDDGQVFNFSAGECQDGDKCEPCSSTGKSSCSYECPDTDPGVISSQVDCHTFYSCDNGNAEKQTCEDPTPFFDGEKCQDNETLCCHCLPYCTADDLGAFIPDPKDCRGFYLCTEEGVPTDRGTCPNEGEYFDDIAQGCSGTTCITQKACANVVGEDGCIDPFTCQDEGFFAKCPGQCTEEYYHCAEATGEYQEAEKCIDGKVFHPDSHTCVSKDECP